MSRRDPWNGFSVDPRGRHGMLRASDADRDHAIEMVTTAYAEGRIRAEDHAARVDAVLAAEHLQDLTPLVSDLAVPLPAVVAEPAAPAPLGTFRAGPSVVAFGAALATLVPLLMVLGSPVWALVLAPFVAAMAPILYPLFTRGERSRGHGGTNRLPRPDEDYRD